MKTIAWIEELDKTMVPLVGGKGANLGEMTKAGLPVPPGFCVTADSYKDFVIKAGIQKKLKSLIEDVKKEAEARSKKSWVDDGGLLSKVAGGMRDLILKAKMPLEMEKEIKEAYKKLCKKEGGEVFVACRSSATAEDIPEASFAGQQATYLDVKGEADVVKNVQMCWASLFTDRATFYREKEGFDHLAVYISVIVQKMVTSEKSGVMFTLHPATNDEKQIMIEGSFGLGESVVSGAVSPDTYVIEKGSFKILDKHLADKLTEIVRSPSGKGTIQRDIDEKRRKAQCLTDKEIVDLAKYGKTIEEHYKWPQDIEWAIEKGKIYIVQSRPVTTMKKEKYEEKPIGEAEIILRGLGASPGLGVGIVKIISTEEVEKIKDGDILVTRMTNPDMVPAMRRATGIITDEGGYTCHAAIVSRELGTPCVVGTVSATKVLKDGDAVTVDGKVGVVYRGKIKKEEAPKQEAVSQVTYTNEEVPVTATKIYVNLGVPENAEKVANLPVDGVGLMREEFIIATYVKEHPLSLLKKKQGQKFIDILADGVAKVARPFYPRPVVLRFSDFKTNEYRGLKGGEEFEPQEENPMIGWRGCSRYITPSYEPAFRLELQAVKKVINDMKLKNLWVMLPFPRTIHEVKKINKILEEEDLERTDDFKLWLMAEVPSNIFLADQFSDYCDGFSIGSNDLTQLILGVDRDSQILGNLGYFDERNEAVTRAIQHLIREAHKKGKTVSICGQAPSVYPEFAAFLVEAGIDSISVNPDVAIKTRKIVAQQEEKILLRRLEKLTEDKRRELGFRL
jgi:pyruvate,water dikinase